MWNEPSFEGTAGLFFTGTPAKLFELQQVTFNTLRSIDPSAQLIGPAFVGDPGGSAATYLQVTQGAYATYADVFGYHFYSGTPERIVDLVRRLREVQQPYGLDTLPLFNTEGGWASRESFPSDPNAVDQALVPGLVARSYIWAKFMGAQRSFYYSYDGYSGLFSAPDSGVPTPAGVAQSQIAKWLEGATFGACFFAGHGTFVCELTRHSLGVGRLVWSTVTSEVVVLPLPAEWGAVETELLDGRKQSLGGAQAIVITGEPQLIKSTTTDWDYAPTAPVSPAASADGSCVPPTEYAAVITAEGPLAYYRFGATDGGIAVDSTDHHRDGVITGAPSALSLAPGPLAFADNGGFDFDSAITGQANAVVAPATVNPWAHDFTVEFWANVHDFSGYQMAVVQEQYLTRGFRLAPQSTFCGQVGALGLVVCRIGGHFNRDLVGAAQEQRVAPGCRDLRREHPHPQPLRRRRPRDSDVGRDLRAPRGRVSARARRWVFIQGSTRRGVGVRPRTRRRGRQAPPRSR